ncbi:hypothetical protein CYLTODRAFT_488004 [Cylindrobasidium torrendii FP15055 ss-10]|uniref:Helicase C-terminal domain-containing protein n=1 Tax=Cylindrobasidium torrendii FP15055 ss-10 TaxID=1314674 RepID=A0A0D7BKE4_9AGAR|nr:hypothetical protein CYLTODRAFT_488004 [Cylindrobasidium torrendii FP15055 ss-10]
MAKAAPKKTARPKGQKSITAFIKGAKKTEEASDTENAAALLDADDEEGVEEEEGDTKSGKFVAPELSSLPPLHDIADIFSDLVERVEEPLKSLASHLAGRKLRVATMCSGTESPLLALGLIQESLQERSGVSFEVEHVFSCEIEPFKQAYIERNFHPPLLFRDIRELGGDKAHTAYGALAPVPGDIDVLIAGTACIDYSNLNNKKKTIHDKGKSGQTFYGMFEFVQKHRPPIVILENVCGAPWDYMAGLFEKEKYRAKHVRMDTKHYYIPHTRQRKYLIAIRTKDSSLPEKWAEIVEKTLRRPASSSLDAFMLPTDDPRVHHSREKLIHSTALALSKSREKVDWSRCESRHQRARLGENLGLRRPFTHWEEGGTCKVVDYAWQDWAVGQVERVWDLMDISMLRAVKDGVDPMFKTQIWNLSQNVDRNVGNGMTGLSPCMTPTMIPYITNRGGPMSGFEALSLQGLPVDRLLLTRETEDQILDLTGNAMSSTVVGASIIAALIAAKSILKPGSEDDDMAVDDDKAAALDKNISGESALVQQTLDLAVRKSISLVDLLERASRSARLCECEGRIAMTRTPLFACENCSMTFCKKCGGHPVHKPTAIVMDEERPRLPPSEFARDMKATLPMSLTLSGFTIEYLEKLKSEAAAKISSESRWVEWCAAVVRASKSDLHFVEAKRQELWRVRYESPHAALDFCLHPLQPEWRLYAKPSPKEPANSDIRKLLQLPVARLRLSNTSDGILDGDWELALPHQSSFDISVEGIGEPVPSWEARLGLQDPEFKDKMVYPELKITVRDEDISNFDRDISGVYTLLPDCGTPHSALHKRFVEGEATPPLYFLMDAHRTQRNLDSFVFSIDMRRLQYGENRPIVARMPPSWRQSVEASQTIPCILPCTWITASAANVQPTAVKDASFATSGDSLAIDVSDGACRSATALVTCTVPLTDNAESCWGREKWNEVDKVHERITFRSLAWIFERVRDVGTDTNLWHTIPAPEEVHRCENCAPTAPDVEWVTEARGKTIPVEDPVQAGEHERRLKRRPTPFVTQLMLDANNVGHVRIGANITSLVHRAYSRLPSRKEEATFSWRIDTNFVAAPHIPLPKYSLRSNKEDDEHSQPLNFKLKLRKEQLRSLHWMVGAESKSVEPFIEEEISEGILDPLGWRAEGRAQRPNRVRGGVLADQVGYGKTVITLALADCTRKSVEKEHDKLEGMSGHIPTMATLVIVPSHLTKQWEAEVKKFIKGNRRTLRIETQADLNKYTIEDFIEADYVFVASTIFKSDRYINNLSRLSCSPMLPSKPGRHYDHALDRVLKGLETQVDRLQEEKGARKVWQALREAEQRIEDEADEKKQHAAKEAAAEAKRLAEAEEEQSRAQSDDDDEESEVETKKKPAKKADPKKAPAKKEPPMRGPKGLKVEVALPRRGSSSPESPASDIRPKRKSAKKVIIIDSDDEDMEKTPKKKGSVASKKRKRPTSDDDDDDFSEPDEEDEDEEEYVDEETAGTSPPTSDVEMDDDSDESTAKSSKAKAKAKAPPPKSKKAAAKSKKRSAGSDSDGMEVDSDATSSSSTNSKKRKSGPAKPAKKQKADTDPWNLESKPVQKDWKEMKAPPLEMFLFARVVVDEYTYLIGKPRSHIIRYKSLRRWVLSGTPPVHNFRALKTIADFLGIHLGVDDDGEEADPRALKKLETVRSNAENFHSFRETHTLEWHAHRHSLGQTFLDQFVRQNIAEIDEIPWTDNKIEVDLPAAERAIYLELLHHLQSLEMTMKKNKKAKNDRERRMAKVIGDSKSAEEALLKRCSHFELEESNDRDEDEPEDDEEDEDDDDDDEDSKSKSKKGKGKGKGDDKSKKVKTKKDIQQQGKDALTACDIIVRERERQLEDCKKSLLKMLKTAAKEDRKLRQLVGKETIFQEYVRLARSGDGVEDMQATEFVRQFLDDADVEPVKKRKDATRKDEKLSKDVTEKLLDHNETAHEIRRITRELVGRCRSLRYFQVVRDLQKQRTTPPKVDCPRCKRKNLPIEDISVLSSCGHTGCTACVVECAKKDECVNRADGSCRSQARQASIVPAETLGVDELSRDKGRYFGMKLQRLVQLIKDDIPSDDRVLVFVQFPDLMAKVEEAFVFHDIGFITITGTATQRSKALDNFQKNSKERVLLLSVMDESASGANLTNANHAIFLSPLLTPSTEIYVQNETQAIGRVKRYGQSKHVSIWRFITKNTIDEDIYNKHVLQLKDH